MNRIWLTLAVLCTSLSTGHAQGATPLTLYVHDTTGQSPDTPLPSLYQLTSTSVGGNSSTVIKMINTSVYNVYFASAFVSTSPTSSVANPNFSVTGFFLDQVLVPGASMLFTVNFTPTATGVIVGYLNLAYQVQQNGCVFSGSTGTVCPANLTNLSTMTGTASAPVLTLSYQSSSGPVVLTPSSESPLNFPNTSLSSTSTITFTLTNPSQQVSVTVPAISLPPQNTTQPGAFSLVTSGVPTSIAAGQSASFDVVFAPSQSGLASGVLQIGSNSYPIQGYGIIVATIDALQISYTNAIGIRTLPQAATPISFGQVVPGSGAGSVLTFSLLNPATSANAVTVPLITLNGNAFSLVGLPYLPVTILPGSSATFSVAFKPLSVGSFAGALSIGSRTFSLIGISINSAIPSFNITTSGAVASQQQLNLVIQLNAPSPVAALGTITLKFTPTVANVTDDSAVQFLATGGRQLNISLVSGALNPTYNGQSSIAFQTGTTAGTITFSVAFPNTTTYTQSFTVPSATPLFTSVQAVRENPNLLVTLNGYDNSYSAGTISFTFYDTSGNVIGSPILYNATSAFQQLYFTGNTYGGLFSLQANFPVSGDVTKVASVTVGLANTLGQTTGSATFQ